MAIRSRITHGEAREDFEVAAVNKSLDSRGTVDLHRNPYEGSDLEAAYGDADNVIELAKVDAFIDGVALPKEMRVQDLLARLRLSDNIGDSVEHTYRKRVRSPLTAIRAYCVSCQGGSPKAATFCDKVECALWPFHRGKNTLRGRNTR